MAIPTSINDLSTVDSTNSPQGGDPVGGNIDDYFRAQAGILARQFKQGNDIASGATLAVPMDGTFFSVTGTITIAQFAATFNGKIIFLKFEDVLTLTNSESLVMPGGTDFTTKAGDILSFAQTGTNAWVCLNVVGSYLPLDGSQPMTGSLQVTDGTDTAKFQADGNILGSAFATGNVLADINAKLGKNGGQMTGPISGATGGVPGFRFDSDTGMFSTGDGDLGLIANNVTQLHFTGSAINFAMRPNWNATPWDSSNLANPASRGTGAGRSGVAGITGQISIYNGGTGDVPSPYLVVGVTVGGGDRPWIALRYAQPTNG